MCVCSHVMSGSRMKLTSVASAWLTSSCCSDCAEATVLPSASDAIAAIPAHLPKIEVERDFACIRSPFQSRTLMRASSFTDRPRHRRCRVGLQRVNGVLQVDFEGG